MFKPLDRAIQLSHGQALEASRHYRRSISPGVQLLGLFDRIGQGPIAANNTGAPRQLAQSAQSSATSRQMARAPRAMTDAIARLQQRPETFDNQIQLFEFVLQSLSEGADLRRCTISVLNRPAKLLRSRFSAGCEQSPALRNFRHSLQRGDLFNKLLQKPLSVQLTTANRAKILPLLPAAFIEASGSDTFLMMSVFKDQQPLAIVYADNGTGAEIDAQQYYLFKQLCGALSQCLGQVGDS